MNDDESDEFEQGRGRSARKREVQVLDALALELLKLPIQDVDGLPVSAEMKRGLAAAISTKARSAKRRHQRHLAGILRERPEEVENLQAHLAGQHVAPIAGDEEIQDLREVRRSLCESEDFEMSLDKASALYPQLDRMKVRELFHEYRSSGCDKSYKQIYKEICIASEADGEDEEANAERD